MNAPRWMSILLLFSLTLSLLLGGMLVGERFREPPVPQHGGMGMQGMGMNLRKQGVRVLGEAGWGAHQAAMEQAARAMRQAREEVWRRLSEEPLDRAGLAAALATLRQRMGVVQEVTHGALLAVAEGLPAEERAALLEQGGPRRGRMHAR